MKQQATTRKYKFLKIEILTQILNGLILENYLAFAMKNNCN